MIPTPPLPQPLIYVLWTLGILAAIVAALRKTRTTFVEEVDERFRIAIRSKAFEEVVDGRVKAAFDGATGPLIAAQNDLAGRVAVAQRTAETAHRRIDKHLEHHEAKEN